MATTSACPDRRFYEQLLAGVYPPDDQLEQLAAHLETCPNCAAVLQSLPRADTILDLIASAGTVPGGGEKEVVARLMDRLAQRTSPLVGQDTSVESSGAAADDLAEILAPSLGLDEIGRLGPYRVLGVLGAGGMGVVLRAEDPKLGRLVALKVMRPKLTADADSRRRFAAEARAMAAVEHDHIVPILHVGEERGVPFLVMPLLRGESLAARLRREQRLPPAIAVRVAHEVAQGLAAAHGRGLIHRDVKPANVWLEERSAGCSVKLLDFGLVRAVAGDTVQTRLGTLVGTPAYMAPEQAAGEAVDARADLFSLGCLLYQMTTGVSPFARPDTMSTLLALAQDRPAPPRQLNPEVPAALDALIRRLLARTPAQRPASAQAVADELAALERGPAEAPAAEAPRAAPLGLGRRRRLGAAVAAGLLLLAGGGLFLPQIVIRIRDRNGNETRLEVPKGNEVIVEQNGKVVATVADGGVKGPAKPKPAVVTSRPGPVPEVEATEPLVPLALVRHPARIPGLRSWTIETRRHRGRVDHGALSPDGRLVAIGGDDGTIRLWDPATGRLVRALLGHKIGHYWESGVACLAWSPDSRRLASGPATASDGTVRIWEADTGRLLQKIQCNAGRLAWSPDGRTLACTAGAVQTWDPDSGRQLPFSPQEPLIGTLAWSPDGKILAGGAGNGVVYLLEYPSGKLLHTLKGHTSAIQALAWSPDGKTLASWHAAGSSKENGRIWDATSGKLLRTLDVVMGSGTAAAYSPDGKILAVGSEAGWGSVQLLETTSGKGLRWLDCGGRYRPQVIMCGLGWLPDGKSLIAVSANLVHLSVCDVQTGKRVRAVEDWQGAGNFALSPDGKKLAAMSNWRDYLQIWDAGSGKLTASVDWGWPQGDGWSTHPIWSPGSRLLAIPLGTEVRLYDGETGQQLRSCRGHTGPCNSLSWSPDGKLLASASADKTVRLWSATSGKLLRTLEGHSAPVLSVAWSQTGKTIASGGEDKTVRFWDAASGKLLQKLEGHPLPISSLLWSPDGKRLASMTLVDGWRAEARVWDAEKGELISSFPGKPLYWSAEGKILAASPSAGKVQFWDVTSGAPLRSVANVTWAGGASVPIWVDDGQGKLGLAVLKRFGSEKIVGVIVPLRGGKGLAISPDGHYRGSPGIESEIVYVAQTDQGQETLTPEEFARRYHWKNDPERVRLAGK